MKVRKKDFFNQIELSLSAISINESLARSLVGTAVSVLDPTVEELADLRCAVSEAVTNCIVHAYRECVGNIYITMRALEGNAVRIDIRDRGCGIEDVERAREPLFTTDAAGERSGMGFTVMESFMDKVRVVSKAGQGTTVTMFKKFAGRSDT